ncbi:mechanosensitive ion channel family protein [Psychrobacter lutiphocae]|uniref:mechanosensitive ion channel family protein n=1 Tax=Psychrobacter lutiphocae TaxID=540500 RepID=UPI001D0F88D8|nr:mechanosensitive ion channel family protein [Psychrobacter lutiphocae]
MMRYVIPEPNLNQPKLRHQSQSRQQLSTQQSHPDGDGFATSHLAVSRQVAVSPQASRCQVNSFRGLWLTLAIVSGLTLINHSAHAAVTAVAVVNVSDSEINGADDSGSEAVASTKSDAEAEAEDKPSVPIPAAGNLTEKDTVIETKPSQVNDADIQQRITGIFSEIEGLKSVNVTVNQGVVSLTGEVPNEKKAHQAISLANRVSDVVAVEDRINRTLDVQDNVTPVIASLKQQSLSLIKALPLLVVAIVVFALVAWFGAWLKRRERLWQRISPNPFVAELLSQTVKIALIIIGLILALSLMGAEAIIGTLLGGAGVIGIAVGFAVKDTIENYIASLMLSIRQPFRARDFVDINGQEGIVVRLTSRATILMTSDGNHLRIPNSEVFKATITNYSKNPERRFTFELGIDANDDPLAAIKVGLDAVCELDFALDTPKASAVITEVGESNIILRFQVWVDQTETDFSKARSIAIREVKHALENHGFSLPEPIYRLRFEDDVEDAIKHFKDGKSNDGKSFVPDDTPFDIKGRQAEEAQKARAKQRAQQILAKADPDEILDTRPDPKLLQKVEEEIQDNTGDKDLLNKNSPQE